MSPATSFRTVTALALLLGAGPSSGAQQPAPRQGDLLVYYCQNLATITVRVVPKGVEVTTATRRSKLPETSKTSPRFTDGTASLSGLDELVRFEEPGAVQWCRSAPAEVPWQEARFRGIDFRAAGEAPEWLLEIDSGVAIEFATGRAPARVTTKFPPGELTGAEPRMTLSAKSGSHTLGVVVEQRVCHHAGSAMTLSVTATFDGKTFTGCGRRLEPVPPDSAR